MSVFCCPVNVSMDDIVLDRLRDLYLRDAIDVEQFERGVELMLSDEQWCAEMMVGGIPHPDRPDPLDRLR